MATTQQTDALGGALTAGEVRMIEAHFPHRGKKRHDHHHDHGLPRSTRGRPSRQNRTVSAPKGDA